MIVDSDVHPNFSNGLRDLNPYMSETRRQRLGIGAFPDPDVAATVAAAYNEWMCERWLQVDERYRGALVVAPQDPEAAVKVPWVKRPPSEYVREHVRFTTQPFVEPHKREHVAALLEMVYAEDTLLFSSDYPHWDFDDPQRALAPVDPELRRRICEDNPRRLYGDRL